MARAECPTCHAWLESDGRADTQCEHGSLTVYKNGLGRFEPHPVFSHDGWTVNGVGWHPEYDAKRESA